jgi:hypothetical protein
VADLAFGWGSTYHPFVANLSPSGFLSCKCLNLLAVLPLRSGSNPWWQRRGEARAAISPNPPRHLLDVVIGPALGFDPQPITERSPRIWRP